MPIHAVPAPALLRSKEALAARWESVRVLLLLGGVPDARARTEAACTGALETWETINGWRRRERAVGSMGVARVLEAALRPLQDIVVQLLRNPGDSSTAAEAVRHARDDFTTLSRHRSAGADTGEAIDMVVEAFRSLEAVLHRTASRAA